MRKQERDEIARAAAANWRMLMEQVNQGEITLESAQRLQDTWNMNSPGAEGT